MMSSRKSIQTKCVLLLLVIISYCVNSKIEVFSEELPLDEFEVSPEELHEDDHYGFVVK